MKMSKKRLELIRQLEAIIGNQCYNSNIQKWGPNGAFYGEGRDFRYPIIFSDTGDDGDRREIKRRGNYSDLQPEVQTTGRYKFGANELHIIAALDKVLDHLEQGHGLKL